MFANQASAVAVSIPSARGTSPPPETYPLLVSSSTPPTVRPRPQKISACECRVDSKPAASCQCKVRPARLTRVSVR